MQSKLFVNLERVVTWVHFGVVVLYRDLVVFCQRPCKYALRFQLFLFVSLNAETVLLDENVITIKHLQSSAETQWRSVLGLRTNLTRVKAFLR